MKHFKNVFLAIIALLAMSFTIASRKGLLKKNIFSSKKSYTCNKTTDIVDFFWCDGSTRTHVLNTTPLASVPSLGTCTFSDVKAPNNFVCDETQNFFCCFEPNGDCSKPTCALPIDATGKKIGTIHYTISHF